MAKMNKRIYGLVGVGARMANWNADFSGRPKTISDGTIFGSDKALKYSIKRYWVNQGEKVLYYKSFTINEKGGEKEKLQPKELIERYNELYDTQLTDKTSSKEVLKNLFSTVDVLNFGATFAVKKQNIGLTGVVQIGQGMNKFENTSVETQDILSPFRNSNNEEANASSLGKKIFSNEAHYLYPFSINPNHYDEYIGLIEGFEGYSEEAYKKVKEGMLIGATALNTNSKSGCENEMTLFITCREGSHLYLPHVDDLVQVSKEEKVTYDLLSLEAMLTEVKEEIESIEIYYNPNTVQLALETDWFKKFNIYTKQEL